VQRKYIEAVPTAGGCPELELVQIEELESAGSAESPSVVPTLRPRPPAHAPVYIPQATTPRSSQQRAPATWRRLGQGLAELSLSEVLSVLI
jgi:hypothetical protein